jgi:hypothetical protein
LALASPEKVNVDHTAFKYQQCWILRVLSASAAHAQSL